MEYHNDFDKNVMGLVGAGQMWGGLHSRRVGPHQPMGMKSGDNYKDPNYFGSLSPVVNSTNATPFCWS
jgi:hypothetical protein